MDITTSNEIEALWEEFTGQRESPEASIDLNALQDACARFGMSIDTHTLHNLFGLARGDRQIRYPQFQAAMAALLGDRKTRIEHAFGFLDSEARGFISTDALVAVAKSFAGEDERAEQLAAELDADGDGQISQSDFLNFLPEDFQPQAKAYRSTPVTRPPEDPAARTESSATDDASRESQPAAKAAPLAQLIGTSPLQLRIGFFRLLQGAAYRSFRENYSANSETHLRARDLPYTIRDFARFVHAAVEFTLGLGVIEEGCHSEFHKLDDMVQQQLQALDERIAHWDSIEKTPEMLAAQQSIASERENLDALHHLFMALVEYVLSLHSNNLSFEHLAEGVLAHHEINRLRQQELDQELQSAETPTASDPMAYLDSWNRVILDGTDERVDGAIMPTRFWYEEFMPQLLRCASITSQAELTALDQESEADLDQWFESLRATGDLDRFATDLRDGFPGCSRKIKQALRQAWTLTEHYLNGVQKRREREEFGRGSGFLSEYVAFIDCYLGRDDVQRAEMRLSFPYYIGPAVWRLLHTSAELMETMPEQERAQAIERFKAFFAAFATMYPCPYCRYHLNRYVVQNREVNMYPVEYLFLGQRPQSGDLHVSIQDKLAYVRSDLPGSMRLFVWKLHNTVNSSIARTEPWFHRDPKPHYTTRYWPSMDSELARAHALGQLSLEVDRLAGIYGVLKPAARLAVLRDELQAALHEDDQDSIDRLFDRAQAIIADLEQEIVASGWLQSHYTFNPTLLNEPPHFTAEDEAFARSGLYVEE